jgi:hypothetical protein
MSHLTYRILLSALLGLLGSCSTASKEESARAVPGLAVERTCALDPSIASAGAAGTAEGEATSSEVKYLDTVECKTDFDALASLPLDVTIPGVRASKFVIDRFDQSEGEIGRLYFQNSKLYKIHYDFVRASIQRTFDASSFTKNYYGEDEIREFYLGSIAYYESSGTWALELAPYDTATAEIVERMFEVISTDKAFFRPALAFHPTSESQLAIVDQLDPSIPVITTDELYKGVDYQPLTKATAMGVLTFLTAADITAGTYVPYYSIVVLDEAPNEIGVVSGIITEQFQSVLSHVNVLSTNRGTPNMGLRGALTDKKLRKHEGQWVELTVAADKYTLDPVTSKEGEDYFQAHMPKPVTLPDMDFTVHDVKNVRDILPDYLTLNNDITKSKKDVRAEILKAVNVYGGKTANYAIMALVPELPLPEAFSIPVYYYREFMRNNGLYDIVDGLLENRDIKTGEEIHFTDDPLVRNEALRDLRNAMMKGEISEELQAALREKLKKYVQPDGTPTLMRFRTSTNSEDLDGFPCAGCYESHSGDPANWQSVLDAIRLAYTSTWLFRTFEERSYYGVEHKSVGMALLVHPTFLNEAANGVAITANPYDATQSDAEAYYVNVAYGGDAEVVHLPMGVLTDQFLYYVGASGNTAAYLSRTNQELPDGKTTILDSAQVGELVRALTTIKTTFKKAYTLNSGWYAMDVEFKFAAQDGWGIPIDSPQLWIKQARPYPDPNSTSSN